MSDSAASNVPAHYPVPGWVPLSYGADGAPDGTDGRPARRLDRREFVKGWLLIVLLLAGATVVNALADNRHAAPWEPWVWEATSSVMLVLLAWLPGVATVAAQSGHPKGGASFWGRLLAIHAGAVGCNG